MEDKNLVSELRRKKTCVTLIMSGSTRRGAGETGASKNLKGHKKKKNIQSRKKGQGMRINKEEKQIKENKTEKTK